MKTSFIFFIFLTGLFVSPFFVHAIEPNEIIVTEIMPNPKAVSDTNGEWFEIYNTSSSTIDLIGCEFKDASTTNSFTISENLLINPESYLVLARKADSTINGGLTVDYAYTSFTLANTVDQIILICAGQEINKVEYSKALGFPLPDGASMMLPNLTLDNNIGTNWCISSTPYGDGDMGTPGSENDICAPETSSGSSSSSSNRPPRPEAGADVTGFINEIIQFDASGSADPDGDKLNYSWNFGDNSTASGKIANHTYTNANIYLVSLTVDDGRVAVSDSLAVSIKEKQSTVQKGELIISELLPNPNDDENLEWIELQNISNKTLDLLGISLKDLTEKIFTFTDEKIYKSTLLPGEFLIIPRATSTIALNNTPPETIYLLDQNKQTIDEVTYNDSALEDFSYALINNEWQWTEIPTPGTENSINNILDEDIFTNTEINEENLLNLDLTTSTDKKICIPNPKAQILLNELWPSPEGDDRQFEFIELKNLNDTTINLCGWQIKDANNTFTLSSEHIIEPQNFLVISRIESDISLNNTGDTIYLYNPNNELVDQTNYPSAKTDISWSKKNNNTWEWTTEVTPGEENIFENNLSTTKTSYNQTAYTTTPINQVNNFNINDNIQVSGIVTAPPGLLGSQIMYLQNESGLQIYQYNKDWPELNLGDEVEIQGTLSFPYGQPRLKVKNKSDIKIINNEATTILSTLFPIEKIDPTQNGTLITISGVLIEKSKYKLFIDDGTGEIEIYIKPSTGISLPELTEGDILEATGIFESNDTSERLLPRYSNDITQVKVAGYDYTAPTKNEIVKSNYDIIDYLYLTGSALIIFLLIKIYQLRKPHGRKKTKQAH